MNKVLAFIKHIAPLFFIISFLSCSAAHENPSSPSGTAPAAAEIPARYTAEQVIEIARTLSPDCRLQKDSTPGSG